jgi:hypothetical protein
VKSPGSPAADADPEVAAVVRLLHRRRGWIWATVVSVVAWLTAAGLLGGLDPDGSGAGAVVGTVFVLLLTVVAVIGLVASVVDTVRLHRSDASVRERARGRTAHYPARAHAYSYPPRHRLTWAFGWITLLILVGAAVPLLPGLVNGVAYLAGAESSTTFFPLSYGQECGRSGCSPLTNGVLADGSSASWPEKVPLGQALAVREPLWNWGYGSGLIDGDATAVVDIVLGVLFDGLAVLVLVHLAKLVSRWLRHRRLGPQGRQMAGPG